MTTPKKANDITPALSKDVTFTEKVQNVDEALKSRAAANKEIKLKWAAVVKVLVKHNVAAPSRRGDAIVAQNLVSNLHIYLPDDKRLEDKAKVRGALDIGYDLNNTLRHPRFMEVIEEKFPKITSYLRELLAIQDLKNQEKEVDEKATQKARTELQAAVDSYIEALEAYDDTLETVANVKEYIGVVKDVAEISAIANGVPRSSNE